MTSSTTPRHRRAALGTTLLALLAPVALAGPAAASTTANEIVFVSDLGNDGFYDLAVRNMETGQTAPVLQTGAGQDWIYDEPELSPRDGSRIAFGTDQGRSDLVTEIAVVNRDGSGLRRLSNPPQTATTESVDVSPSWSPGEDKILFTRITQPKGNLDADLVRTALYTVTTTGTPVVQAVAQASNGYTGDWSPTGDRIVFAALAPGAAQGPLTIISANGTGTPVTLSAQGLMPAWSPDGSTIAHATITVRDPDRSAPLDVAQIAVVPAVPGRPATVFAATRPDPSRTTVAEYPTWMPDGQSIVYDMFEATTTEEFLDGDLWAVDKGGLRAGRVMGTPTDEAQPGAQGPTPSSVVPGAASTYVPVTPRRVLDTRPAPNNVGARAGKVGPGGTVDLPVHGISTAQGVVPPTATAVVLNVTVAGVTAATDVRVYPTPTDPASFPRSSNINAAPGQVVPNLVTATLGSGGAVRLRNTGGTVDLIADIAGYYVPAGTAGVGFTALDPGRVLDTRPAPNNVGAPVAKLGAAGVLDLQVTGALRTVDGRSLTVPSDAAAVVLNVTAVGATTDTDVRVYPTPGSGAAVPLVSNLNLAARQTAANLVTVAVGSGGKVRLRNASGAVDLVADVAGYYSAGSTGRFVPVAPLRFLDTRSGIGAAPISTPGGGSVDLGVGGSRGVPAGATAVVLNLTATGVTTSTNVRAYPSTAGVPTVSNLNLDGGQTRANAAIVKLSSDGRVRIRNASGDVQLISDLAGYMVG